MDIVSALASLVRVTETGSFSAAARERKAAVARQISFLEQDFACGLSDDVQHGDVNHSSLTDSARSEL
ncbi:hypothetical protein ACH79_13480 [Bradyrhizobium sp. CCBAU 051011]|nr:hypothetical protein ACH79_13480 [Bradyrhizobium sp. CCBAU 051011]